MPRAPRLDSRTRLLEAASQDFADHGYGGANVDRIARRARINKAMIYYYFQSKVGLYREVLRGMYRGIGARVTAIRDAPLPADEALAGFIGALVDEAGARPYLPRIMMRELADHARHLDAATIELALAVPAALADIVTRGVREGRFRAVSPALVYLSIIGPLILFLGTAPLRARVEHGPMKDIPNDRDIIREHLRHAVMASLRPEASSSEPVSVAHSGLARTARAGATTHPRHRSRAPRTTTRSQS